MSTLYIGIEVPRSPQSLPDGRLRSNGEWQAGSHRLLDRWLKLAVMLAPADQIRLITGSPDQAVYDLIEQYPGTVEVALSDWVGNHSARAADCKPGDAVLLIRSQSAIASAAPIHAAIKLLQGSSRLNRVEPALRPMSDRLVDAISLNRSMQTRFSQLLGVGAAEMTEWMLPLPIFELTRLAAFRPSAGLIVPGSSVGFVEVSEESAVLIETPLDLLRAELICEAHPVESAGG